MSISLKVLAPNQNVYEGEAEEVILPSTTGQIGVLPGPVSYTHLTLPTNREV